MLYFKGSDVRFGARGPLLFQRDFCVAGAGLAVLQGVWCTLWRARAVALPAGLLRGTRGACSTSRGLGARGPPAFQRDFDVAGVGLAVLQAV